MDKVLSQIQSAETEAANTIAHAKEEAAKILNDAKAKCTEISEGKIKEAQQTGENTISAAKTQAEALYDKIISEYNEKCVETEKRAQTNVNAAADAIINHMI